MSNNSDKNTYFHCREINLCATVQTILKTKAMYLFILLYPLINNMLVLSETTCKLGGNLGVFDYISKRG